MRYAWEEGFLEGEEVGRADAAGCCRRCSRACAGRISRARPGPTCSSPTRAHVAERIERYYGRAAEVVHPPVDVEHFLGAGARGRGDYYLAFGRVVPYKRVDLAVGGLRARWAGR